METLFHFVGYPQRKYQEHDLINNPYSGYTCKTLNTAKWWAEALLKFNTDFDFITYMRKNGRKVYTLERY